MRPILLPSLLFILLTFSLLSNAQTKDTRSDSIDILNYSISLSMPDITTKTIAGHCVLSLKPKFANINKIRLDLLRLNVTGITQNLQPLTYTYNDTLLVIDLAGNLSMTDTTEIRVDYNGQPTTDGSSFGGFYWVSNYYAFNLGVGFAADPHNYGRVWFPCFDNFTTRSTYDFEITTDSSFMAICGGLLQSVQTNGTLKTWKWKLHQPIPTYLASVAVAPFTPIYQSYSGITGAHPVILAAIAQDSANMRASFINLHKGLQAFENAFGPYLWDRVGFTAVPFLGGAMEHATNIAYPIFAIDGTLGRETLWAHELSHHWWGDLITCRTPEDMWINEGFASYSERIFLEHVYGKNAYKTDVRRNHLNVLRSAHLNDDGYRAVSGVPHAYTYGSHVYNKGADVAHTLRSYMGDVQFFYAVKDFMNTYKFRDVSSEDLRIKLQQNTTADLTAFFDNWIYQPGFPHFQVGAYTATPQGSNYEINIWVDQRLKAAPNLFYNVPLEITFFDADWKKEVRTFTAGGIATNVSFTVPFNPVYYALDMEEKISDAVTDEYKVIKAIGTYDFTNALFTVNVSNITDSALLRVEHHWVGPEPKGNAVSGIYLSTQRYWKVEGIVPNGFTATATIQYDGRSVAGSGTGFLDNELIKITEDSLFLLYRADITSPWQIHHDYTKLMGSKIDKTGSVTIKNMKTGEYAFGMRDHTLSATTREIDSSPSVQVYPNPSNNKFIIELSRALDESARILVMDMNGAEVAKIELPSGQKKIEIDTARWKPGYYFLRISGDSGLMVVKRIMIGH
jgi:aminopeptidase N